MPDKPVSYGAVCRRPPTFDCAVSGRRLCVKNFGWLDAILCLDVRLIAGLLVVSIFSLAYAPDFRLVRSLSGPSGKVEDAKFVFDESRTRFIHPQDKSFVVYFEWDGPSGTHTLTGLWKQRSRPLTERANWKIEFAGGRKVETDEILTFIRINE